MYRLFSWEHSYFSGKARSYLRYKERLGALGPGFEDILATPELIGGLLMPRSGSGAIPQLEAPDGTWIQDSSEIIDYCEAAHPEPARAAVIPDAESRPRQRLASYLIELLADEWVVVPAFWQRWFFSEDGREPNHRAFNEQQWGAVSATGSDGFERREAGGRFFETVFGISTSRSDPKGVYAGLIHLGCSEKTEHAWQQSQHRLLERLEVHFAHHDYLLGGKPSLGDFGLIGPLYAHLYRDAIPGFALRTHFPLVCEWVERTNGEGSLNARSYGQKLYSLDDAGKLVGRVANSDGGEWLPADEIPETLIPVLEIFFEEMWPTLQDAAEVLRNFVASDDHEVGDELPGKTFTASPGFIEHQTDNGALTHSFEIGGIRSERMVIPYQFWMLGRIASAMHSEMHSEMGSALDAGASKTTLVEFLEHFPNGASFMQLEETLAGCRIRKEGARLYSVQ